LNKYKTPKLFYKEYPYKAVFYTKFANSFRGNDLAYIREMLDRYYNSINNGEQVFIRKWREQIRVTTADLSEVQTIYSTLSNKKDYKVRVEQSFLSIYSTQRYWLYNLASEIDAYEWWEPEFDLEPNVLIMGPKMKGWEYKITFSNNVPSNFGTWALANLDKLKIGNKLKDYLQKGQYIEGYYFYVRNEKMLNLASLVLGQGIQRIDKIVIDDQNA